MDRVQLGKAWQRKAKLSKRYGEECIKKSVTWKRKGKDWLRKGETLQRRDRSKADSRKEPAKAADGLKRRPTADKSG
jgi:hypothetical protein